MASDVTYSPLHQDEKLSSDGLGYANAQHTCRLATPRSQGTQLLVSMAFNAILLVGILLLGGTLYLDQFALNTHLRKCSTFSPVHDRVDLGMQTKTINGSFWPGSAEGLSVSRQAPNDRADAVWEEWSLPRILPLSRDEVVMLGKDPETATKLDDEIWGLGDDAYAGSLDVFHQLHCLNTLRQIAYGQYYNKSMASAERQRKHEIHLNHCVDILMQALQCSANVNVITWHWVETQHYPFPDFSVNRKCIDFDKLTEWRAASTIDTENWDRVMRKPAGVKQRPMADQYYTYYNQTNPNHPDGLYMDTDFNI